MANQEHLDLLKQSSSAWNAWRVQHKEVRPDLSGADLSLSYANLGKATLVEAYLYGADFIPAPYEFYDWDQDPEDLAELLDPPRAGKSPIRLS